jgi:NADH:ubiquinone oxidoreductase subunit F (NADH-binding)
MTAIDNAIREPAVQQQTHHANAVLPPHPLNLPDHHAYYGPLPTPDQLPLGELAAMLGHAGVRGRGGAGFPLHRKIFSVSGAARARRVAPTIIANGCEGEPASHKDKYLLHVAPHLVLDGLVLLGRELRATRAILAIEAAAPHGTGDLARRLHTAIAERDMRQDGVRIELVEIPGRFIAGESAALVSTLNGGPGLPTYREHSVREHGVADTPTLIQNVETIAQTALIARYGADWFRTFGTPAEPGPQLFTIYAARLVRSALTVFRTEIAAHRAGICTGPGPRPLLPAPNRERTRS